MVEIVRTAVVGLGTAAQSLHLPMLLRRHDRFETVAVVDISERRRTDAAAKWRISEDASYASVADLMAAVRAKDIEVDAVIYAADGLRADDVLQIIKRGIPVLLQPPAGYGSADIQQIIDYERLTGRSLVMMANTQLYDPSLDRFLEDNRARDLRILEFETLMPAESAMYAHHYVTSAAYDIPAEVRTQRRDALEAAVLAGAGEASTSADRNLFVKGLLTGMAYQLSVLRWMFGPLMELHSVRQWPEGVIPGSIEVSGAVADGAHVRIAWHYLPFAPQLRDSIRFVAIRRQGRIQLASPADADARSTYFVTQRAEGRVTGTEILAESSALAAMHEAFYAFVAKGEAPRSGLADALADTELARQLLGELAAADGRSLDAEPAEPESAAEPEPEPKPESQPEPESESDPESDSEPDALTPERE